MVAVIIAVLGAIYTFNHSRKKTFLGQNMGQIFFFKEETTLFGAGNKLL